MKVKALTSFCGTITMTAGEVAEIRDPAIAADLIKAKYVEEVGKEKSDEGKNVKARNGAKRK